MVKAFNAATATVAVWSSEGFGAKNVQVGQLSRDHVEVSFIACRGDVCERKSLQVPAAKLHGAPDGRLCLRLYSQPVAILAVGGILLLAACCFVENQATDLILKFVYGRIWGWRVLIAAIVAHVGEATYGTVVSRRIGLSASAAAVWFLHVLIVGFPVLQWLLRLEKAAMKAKPK